MPLKYKTCGCRDSLRYLCAFSPPQGRVLAATVPPSASGTGACAGGSWPSQWFACQGSRFCSGITAKMELLWIVCLFFHYCGIDKKNTW